MPDPKGSITPQGRAKNAIQVGKSKEEFEARLKYIGLDEETISASLAAYDEQVKKKSSSASSTATGSMASIAAMPTMERQESGDSDYLSKKRDLKNRLDFADVFTSSTDGDISLSIQSIDELNRAKKAAESVPLIEEDETATVRTQQPQPNAFIQSQLDAAGQRRESTSVVAPVEYNQELEKENIKFLRDNINAVADLDENATVQEKFEANKELILEANQKTLQANREKLNESFMAITGSSEELVKSDENGRLFIDERSYSQADVLSRGAIAEKEAEMLAQMSKGMLAASSPIAGAAGVESMLNGVSKMYYGVGAWFGAEEAAYRLEDLSYQTAGIKQAAGISNDKVMVNGSLRTISEMGPSEIIAAVADGQLDEKYLGDVAIMSSLMVAENLPQIALTIGTGAIGGGAGLLLRGGAGVARGMKIGQTVGSIALGASSGGQTWADTYGKGEEFALSLAYSLTDFAAEVVAESVFRGLDNEASSRVLDFFKKGGAGKFGAALADSKVLTKLSSQGIKAIKSGAEEGTEELITSLISQGVRKVVEGQEMNPYEFADSFLLGALSGGVTSAGMATLGNSVSLLQYGASKIPYKLFNTSVQLSETRQQLVQELQGAKSKTQAIEIQSMIQDIDMKLDMENRKKMSFYNSFSKEDADKTVGLNQKMRNLADKIKQAKSEIDSGLPNAQMLNTEKIKTWTAELTEAAKEWTQIHEKYDSQTQGQVSGVVQDGQVTGQVSDQEGSTQATETSGVVQESEEIDFGGQNSLEFTEDSIDDLNARIESLSQDSRASQLLTSVRNSVAALKSVGKGSKIVFHKTLDAMAESTGLTKSQVSGRAGMYNTSNGEVHIFMPLAKNNTTYHEVLHKIGESVDSKFQQRFVDSVIRGLKSNERLAERYGKFISQYEGKDLRTHELFTEIMSDIAAGNVEIQSVTPSLIQEIKKFFQELFGIDANYTDADLARYMGELATTLGAGGDINVIAEKLNGEGFVFSDDFGDQEEFLNSLAFDENDNTNRPQRIPKGIKKETVSSVLKKSGGKFALINSDPTGYKKQDLLGKTIALLGGIGYSFTPKNIKDGVGFASTKTSKVFSVLRGAYRTSEGKNIPVFVLTNSMKSLFGNYYAMDYLANALKSAFDNGLTQEEYESNIREIISKINFKEEKDGEEKTSKKDKAPKKTKEQMQNEIFEAIKNFNINDFISISKKDDTPLTFNVRNKMFEALLPTDTASAKKNVISEKINRAKFNQESFVRDISEEHLFDTITNNALAGGVFSDIVKKDGTISFAEMSKKNLGTIQSGFYFDFENPNSINSKYIAKILELEEKTGKDWADIPANKKAKLYKEYEAETADKGIKHPQFNAKFMGANPFILDGSYHFPSLYNNPAEIVENFNTVGGKSSETLVYLFTNEGGFKLDSDGNKIFKKNGIINAISQSIYILSSGSVAPTSKSLKEAKISDSSKLIDMVNRLGVYEFYLDQVEKEAAASAESVSETEKTPSNFLSQYSIEYAAEEGSKNYDAAVRFAERSDIRFSGAPLQVVKDKGRVIAALFSDFAGDIFSFDIAVDKDHRRNGIASNLIRTAIREFDTIKDFIPELEWQLNVVNEDMKNLLEQRFGFKTRPDGPDRWIAYERNSMLYQNSGVVNDVALMIKNGMDKESIVNYFMEFDNMLKEDAEFLYEHGLAKSQKRLVSPAVSAEYRKNKAWAYKFKDEKAQEIVDNAKSLIERYKSTAITATKLKDLMADMAEFATDGKLKKREVVKLINGMLQSSDFLKSNEATQASIIDSVANALAQLVETTNAENNNKLTAHLKNIDSAKRKIKELVSKVNSAKKSSLGIAGMRIPKAFSNAKQVQKYSTIDVNFLSPEMMVEFLNDLAILEARLSEVRFKRNKDTGVYEVTNPYVDQVTRSGEVIKVDMRKGAFYLNDRFGVYSQEVMSKKTFALYDEAFEMVKQRREKGDKTFMIDDALNILAGRETMKSRAAKTQKKMEEIADKLGVDLKTLDGFNAVIEQINQDENEVKQEKRDALINQIADNTLSFYGYLLTDKFMSSILGLSWDDVTDPYRESFKGGEAVKRKVVARLNKLSTGALNQIEYAINDLMANYSRAGLAVLEARVRAEVDGNAKLRSLGMKSTNRDPKTKKNFVARGIASGSKVVNAFANRQTLFRRFFSNYSTDKIVEVLGALGINQLEMSVAAADGQYNRVKSSVDKIIANIKRDYGTDFDTVKNNTLAQIFTMLRQKPENMSDVEWYKLVRDKVKTSVEYYSSSDYDSFRYSNKQIEEMQEAVDLAFDIAYINEGTPIEKAIQNLRAKVDGIEKYVDSMVRIHESFTEPFKYYTETVLGKELKVENNYTPFRFRNRKEAANLFDAMNSVSSIEDTMKNITLAGLGRQPGAAISRQDYAIANKDVLVDLNFKGVNLNSIKQVTFAINTGPQLAYVDQITKETSFGQKNGFSETFKDRASRDLFRKSLINYLSDIRSVQEQYMTPFGRRSIRFLRSTSAVYAFGSIAAQVVKQSSVVLASMSKMDIQSSMSTIMKIGDIAARSVREGVSETAGIGISNSDYSLISNSSILLRDTDEGFFNPMSEEYEFKASSKVNRLLSDVREKGTELSLFTMRKTDKIVAVASWLGFYEAYLRKERILDSSEDFSSEKESKNPNEKAIAYANMMVARDHNQSTRRDMAVGMSQIKNSEVSSLVYGIIVPYASFAINKKINMITDVSTLSSKEATKEAKAEAARSLVGNTAEAIVFAMVSQMVLPLIYESIAGLFGGEDEEEKGKLDNYKFMSVIRRLVVDLNPYIPPVGAIEEGYVKLVDKARYTLSRILDDKDYAFSDEDSEEGYERWRVMHGLPSYDRKQEGASWFQGVLSSMGVMGSPIVTITNSFNNLVSLAQEDKIKSATGKEYFIRDADRRDVAIGLTVDLMVGVGSLFGFGAQEFKGVSKALQMPAKQRALNEGEKLAEQLIKESEGQNGDFSFIEDKVQEYIDGQNFSAAAGLEGKLEAGATKLTVEKILKEEFNGNKFIKDLRTLSKVEQTGRGLGVIVDDILQEYDSVDEREKFIKSAIVYFGADSESKAGYMVYYLNSRGWADELSAEE